MPEKYTASEGFTGWDVVNAAGRSVGIFYGRTAAAKRRAIQAAAAPDLLAALRKAVSELVYHGTGPAQEGACRCSACEAVRAARAAIARADKEDGR